MLVWLFKTFKYILLKMKIKLNKQLLINVSVTNIPPIYLFIAFFNM